MRTLLTLAVLVVMVALGRGQERTWTGTGGKSFRGSFLRVDRQSGKYVFKGSQGQTYSIDPAKLSKADIDWIQSRQATAGQTAAASQTIAYRQQAVYSRKWTSTDGRTTEGRVVSVSNSGMVLQVAQGRGTVPLEKLAASDRTAALLWSGANGEPMPLQTGRIVYELSTPTDQPREIVIECQGARFRLSSSGVEDCCLVGDLSEGVWRRTGGKMTSMVGKWGPEQLPGPPATGELPQGKWQALLKEIPNSPFQPKGEWPSRFIAPGIPGSSAAIRDVQLHFSALDCPVLLAALDVLLSGQGAGGKVLGMRDARAIIFSVKGLGTQPVWHELLTTLGPGRLIPVSLSWKNKQEAQSKEGPDLNRTCQLQLKAIECTPLDKALFEIHADAAKLEPGTATHLR